MERGVREDSSREVYAGMWLEELDRGIEPVGFPLLQS